MAIVRTAYRNIKRLMILLARLLIIITSILVIIMIPIMSYELYRRGREPLIIAWYSAGAFAILGILISVHGIVKHLTHYDQPTLQRYVVRILFMVPIYAIESWFALRFKEYHVYLQILREAYESFVIYSFLKFLIYYLGEEERLIQKLELKPKQKHLFPINLCLPNWAMGREFLLECKWGTLQYVIVMNISSILVWIMDIAEVYQEGNFSPKTGYTYITILKNFSQCWALYCLVFFYKATREDLAPLRPLAKFICVKAVVFFSFWQSVAIALLVHFGYISPHHDWTVENVATGLQDFMICIEMFAASIAHHFVFPYSDFVLKDTSRESFIRSFIHSTIPTDVYQEMQIMNRKKDINDDATSLLEHDDLLSSAEVSDELT